MCTVSLFLRMLLTLANVSSPLNLKYLLFNLGTKTVSGYTIKSFPTKKFIPTETTVTFSEEMEEHIRFIFPEAFFCISFVARRFPAIMVKEEMCIFLSRRFPLAWLDDVLAGLKLARSLNINIRPYEPDQRFHNFVASKSIVRPT